MRDLGKLSPAALSAAMRGGTELWGTYGSATNHEDQNPHRLGRRRHHRRHGRTGDLLCRAGRGSHAEGRVMTPEQKQERTLALIFLGLFLAGCVTGYLIALWWPL